MNEAVRPTLLSAARAFMRGSTRAAALAIVPLATVSVVNQAKAQAVVFGTMASSGSSFSSVSGGSSHSSGGFFSTPLAPLNNIAGVRFGDVFYIFSPFGSGTQSATIFYGNGSGIATSGSLANGMSFPIAYDFGISPSAGITINSWSLSVRLFATSPADNQLVTINGSAGVYAGSSLFTLDRNLNDLSGFDIRLTINFNSANGGSGGGDHFTVAMDGTGQGLTLNPIPEPSTYAILCGLGALGFVIARRSRRALAA